MVLPGGYVAEEAIAAGGMGIVHRGRAPDGTPVAIKLMRGELLSQEVVRERFLREHKALDRVHHPAVPRAHVHGTLDDGTVFLVMELLEGQTMAERLEQQGYLSPQEVLVIADGILDVLSVAHERDVLHRDVKPENIFLMATGGMKLLDFGVARLRETGQQTLTHAGWALGTPAFMAPEQASGDWASVDVRTDLWAVGATMFTGLTGHVVHEAENGAEELLFAATRQAPSLRDVIPGVRPALVELVDRALRFEKSERFTDATEMRDRVAEVWEQLGSGPMANAWSHIAADLSRPTTEKHPVVHPSKFETRVGAALRPSGPVLANSAASSASPDAPSAMAARRSQTGWSVPPPGDITRIADSADFPELEDLLQSGPRPILPDISGHLPSISGDELERGRGGPLMAATVPSEGTTPSRHGALSSLWLAMLFLAAGGLLGWLGWWLAS